MSAELKPCPCCQQKGWLEKREGVQRITSGAWYRERAYCRNKKCGVTTATFNRPDAAAIAWNARKPDVNADLLDALQNILFEDGDKSDNDRLKDRVLARAAIAKAQTGAGSI